MSQLSPEIEEERDGLSFETVYEDEALRVSGIRGGDKALFVAFTGIGHRLGAMQREEFVRISQGGGEHSVLFVQDKTRSWYNEPTFAATLQPIVAAWAARCEKVVTIGNSMGGFGAIVFAGLLDADVAIAFSPQLSVSSTVVPQENRWSEFTSKITDFIYDSAASYIVDGPEYYLFQGDGGKDWYHVGGFPIRPNVHHYVIPQGPHNLASILKARGFLSKIVAACKNGDLDALREIMVTYNGAVLRSADGDPYANGRRPSRDRGRLDPTASLPELPRPSRELHTADERRELRRTLKRVDRQTKRWAEKQTDRLARREATREELLAEARAALVAETQGASSAEDERDEAVQPQPPESGGPSASDRRAPAQPGPVSPADHGAAKPRLETIFEDQTLHVSGIRGGDEILFIAFTEIGDRVGPLRREEFIDLTQATGESSVLFVGDRQRTWYNAPAFLEHLAPIVAEWRAGCQRTVTIGNSMGGFGAIVFAGALGADTAIAFSPQYSVSKRVVPKEDRWSEFISKIGEFRYESAADYVVDGPEYYLFQGDGGKDRHHVRSFPIRPNLHQFIIRGGPHNLAASLKTGGFLSRIVEAGTAGDLEALREIMVTRNGAVQRSAADDPYADAPRAPLDPTTSPPASPEPAREPRRAARRRVERRTEKRADRLAAAAAPDAEDGPSLVPTSPQPAPPEMVERADSTGPAAEQPEPGKPGLETIFEDQTLHVSGIRGGDKILFIAFTEIGDRVGPLRREEFIDLTQATGESSVLFVGDRQRTWYNAPAFLEHLAPIVAEWRAGCQRTVTIGNSMGGFGAIVFAGALGADTAIAFSPQYSVSKRVVPKEDRWSEFISKIGEFRYESAGDHIVDGCTYFLFQGDGGKDWYQIGGFPIRPNLHQFIVRDGPHTLASLLKLRGDLAPIIQASVAGDLKALDELMFAQGNARLRSEENDPYRAAARPRRELPRGEPLRTLPLEPVVVEVKSPDEQQASRRAENQQKRRAAKQAERDEQRRHNQRVLADLANVGATPKSSGDEKRRAAAEKRLAAAEKRKAAAEERKAALVAKGRAAAAAKLARRQQRQQATTGVLARIRRFFRGLVRKLTGGSGS